ncbi:VOC family protein [Nocardia sp. NPDC052566]|uniref:VOC family protein n=1 Tax=Nocardia sp. NPDC052566 TaxID=3364330 RepID=UPI0037C981E1
MTTPKPGDPTWVDLYSADPDRAIAFYGELFGWTAERAGEEFGGYITFRKDGKAVAGGMGRMDGDDGPDQWTIYLASADAAATADAAAAHGGTVVVPAMAVGEVGTMAILADNGGAGIGVWQAGTSAGFEAIGIASGGHWSEHAGIPTWFELHTGAYDAALDFYRGVFGWQDPFALDDGSGFRYTTIHAETPMLGGVMDTSVLMPGTPASWTVYFGAEDVDKATEQVAALGGAVLMPPMDTPYGRVSGVADPTGARFSIGGNKI